METIAKKTRKHTNNQTDTMVKFDIQKTFFWKSRESLNENNRHCAKAEKMEQAQIK